MRRPRLTAPVVALAAVALVAGVTASVSTAAIPTGGTEFGAAPKPDATLGPRAYFSFTMSAGGTTHDAVVVDNSSATATALKIGASRGATATGSGDAYVGAYGPCSGPACWISGLPATVTVGPHKSRTIPFTVTVPAGTPDRQYLAGITVEPVKSSAPVSVGGNQTAGAEAVIIHQVNVGIAITIGDLSRLTSRLEIVGLTTATIGSTPRLLVEERNTGQTFMHSVGGAVCTGDGHTHEFQVVASTILPGEEAVLTVNAPGLPLGASLHCVVNASYPGGSAAAWKGNVVVPAVAKTKVVHTGPGSYSTLPASKGTPNWAIALIAVGAVVALLLLALVLMVFFRQRRGPGGRSDDASRSRHSSLGERA
jgi:hypothetical protein